MTKRMQKPVIITASILTVILAAVITLCCITVRPLKPFTDYSGVTIESSTNSNLGDITAAGKTEIKASFDKGLKKSGFSVMHAMLEFVYSYGPKFEYKTEKNDKDKDVIAKDADGNKIKKEMTFAEVKAACIPSETAYVLTFNYDAQKTFKVGKETVKFDRLRMAVSTTDGEVKWVTIYPYINDLTHGEGNPDVDAYRINPITVRANLSSLYINLGQIETDISK